MSEKEWAGTTILGVNHLLSDQQERNPETRAGGTTWEMGSADGKRTETAPCHPTVVSGNTLSPGAMRPPTLSPGSRGGWRGWISASPHS